MRLRFYRFMESIFSYPAAYFGDLADAIDTELHQELREAMKDIQNRTLRRPNPSQEPTSEGGVESK